VPSLQFLFNVYDTDRSGSIAFDEFIQICCELKMLTDTFNQHDTQRTGRITLDYEAYVT
jgi:Ca2+-binding EF-hand superfamily protein